MIYSDIVGDFKGKMRKGNSVHKAQWKQEVKKCKQWEGAGSLKQVSVLDVLLSVLQ